MVDGLRGQRETLYEWPSLAHSLKAALLKSVWKSCSFDGEKERCCVWKINVRKVK